MSTITTTIFSLDPMKSIQQIVQESYPGANIALYDVIATYNTFTLMVKASQLNTASFTQVLNAHIGDIDINWSEIAYSIAAQAPMSATQFVHIQSTFIEQTIFDFINIENVLQIEARLVFSDATTAEVVVSVYTSLTEAPITVSVWRLENISVVTPTALANGSTATQTLANAPAISAKVTKLI